MNLILDVGNTRTKVAVFKDTSILENCFIETTTIDNVIKLFLKNYPKLSHSIISSTAQLENASLKYLHKKTEVLQLSHKTNVFFNNAYSTKQTLGLDRIALVAAASKTYQNKNVLVIDAGTCVTYDIITKKNTYVGGIISPGLEMRHKAMHKFTANLPLLTPKIHNTIIGTSTASCMEIGALNGLVNEIDGFIEQYQENYNDLTVILTGGDAKMLAKRIKNSIFANSNFLLEGLNHILEFNKYS